jgi:hypothetical protein
MSVIRPMRLRQSPLRKFNRITPFDMDSRISRVQKPW